MRRPIKTDLILKGITGKMLGVKLNKTPATKASDAFRSKPSMLFYLVSLKYSTFDICLANVFGSLVGNSQSPFSHT